MIYRHIIICFWYSDTSDGDPSG